MFTTDDLNYYDVLEIQTDATPQEVREAYLRLKSAYRQGSLAAYSLVSEDETGEILRKVEDAFQILSHSEKRKEYDKTLGYIGFEFPTEKVPSKEKIVSIDRVPPMEEQTTDDLLIPPSTDFSHSHSHHPPPFPTLPKNEPQIPQTPQTSAAQNDQIIQQWVLNETEWRGELIRKIRELRKVGLEDLASRTKIQRKYLRAIEEENYKELPAIVFVRGFLNQLSRELKLPSDRVVTAYLDRYKRVKPNV